MSDDFKQTIRIHRKAMSKSDDADPNVWTEPVDTVELELVSTVMLKQILTETDSATKRELESVAAANADFTGVLARDVESDRYEMVDADGNEEFSLVSTQMLQIMLTNDPSPAENEDPALPPPDLGVDPYNSD